MASEREYQAKYKDLPELTVHGANTNEAALVAVAEWKRRGHKGYIDPLCVDLLEVLPLQLTTGGFSFKTHGTDWAGGAVPQQPIGDDEDTQPGLPYPFDPADVALTVVTGDVKYVYVETTHTSKRYGYDLEMTTGRWVKADDEHK